MSILRDWSDLMPTDIHRRNIDSDRVSCPESVADLGLVLDLVVRRCAGLKVSRSAYYLPILLLLLLPGHQLPSQGWLTSPRGAHTHRFPSQNLLSFKKDQKFTSSCISGRAKKREDSVRFWKEDRDMLQQNCYNCASRWKWCILIVAKKNCGKLWNCQFNSMQCLESPKSGHRSPSWKYQFNLVPRFHFAKRVQQPLVGRLRRLSKVKGVFAVPQLKFLLLHRS